MLAALFAVITVLPAAITVTAPESAPTVATAGLLLEYVMAPVPAPPEAALVKAASPTVLAMGPVVAKAMVCATGGGGGGGGGGGELPPPPQALKYNKAMASSSGPRSATRTIMVPPRFAQRAGFSGLVSARVRLEIAPM